jgi:hypothetical protein
VLTRETRALCVSWVRNEVEKVRPDIGAWWDSAATGLDDRDWKIILRAMLQYSASSGPWRQRQYCASILPAPTQPERPESWTVTSRSFGRAA